jgi:hypothetical protein
MDNYRIVREHDFTLFMSPYTGVLYVLQSGSVFSIVHTARGKYFLGDLGGFNFLNNLVYVGEV